MDVDEWGVPATITCDHRWEKIEVTKCHILPNDDGEPIVILDPDSQATIGCGICYAILDEIYPVTT